MKSNFLSLLSLGFEPPVSFLVPAYNDEATIAVSVPSMLHVNSISRPWDLLRWLAGAESQWGDMRRTASSYQGS
jgi:hypothetical protein